MTPQPPDPDPATIRPGRVDSEATDATIPPVSLLAALGAAFPVAPVHHPNCPLSWPPYLTATWARTPTINDCTCGAGAALLYPLTPAPLEGER